METDVASVAAKYFKWWDVYTEWRNASQMPGDEALLHKREVRQKMLDESEGLLGALKLPNDVSSCTLAADADFQNAGCSHGESDKHMYWLRKAGMIKEDPSTSSAYLVGPPAALQYSLQNLFSRRLAEFSINVSAPYFVRGAIIDGVNVSKESFPCIASSANKNTDLYLTGRGLPSLVALLVKKSVSSQTEKWPVRLQSHGAAYSVPLPNNSTLSLNNISQCTKAVLLSLCRSEEEEYLEYLLLIKLLQEILAQELCLKIASSALPAYSLMHFESAATSVMTEARIEIARVCTVGSYISRRLSILFDSELGTVDFVRMTFAEVNLTRVVAAIVEEHLMKESVPEDIRQLLKRTP
ncbi:unnamed protein product [Gongylonema pulchrum]|uniref:Uncharacterized protein n=1 Tax=Gongylonema pulchrum TaxID=637853 RepID=A0A3P7NVC8_9BILA|nr:unnamed protein product [Gongylonema pulchrum]